MHADPQPEAGDDLASCRFAAPGAKGLLFTSSTGSALIYLHDSDERQRKLAEAHGDAALAELQRRGSSAESGTDLARDDHSTG